MTKKIETEIRSMVAANIKYGDITIENLMETSEIAKRMWGKHTNVSNKSFLHQNVYEYISEICPYADLSCMDEIVDNEIERNLSVIKIDS